MSRKTRLDGGVESGYGYGLAVDELGGHRQLSHSGRLDGADATMSYFADDSVIVVVLSNTEGARVAELKDRIARHLLGIRRLTRVDVADVPLVAADRARYTGTYILESMGVEVTVSEAAGRLRLSIAGQAPLPLLYQGDHRFLLEQDLETSLQFTLEDGRATRVVVRTATGNLVPGRRIH